MSSAYALFPSKEEWGTGDEAMDNKLSIALKKVISNLSMESISEFYFYGLTVKPRAFNPAFQMNIELVTKALLAIFSPTEPNDQLLIKLKGQHHLKSILKFELPESAAILEELKIKKIFRYQKELDFYLNLQHTEERNPFVQYSLVRSKVHMHVKILMKDFRSYLNGDKNVDLYQDKLFRALRTKDQILFIEDFAQLWYHEDQIFSLPLFDY